ncbi:hypothetical protein HDU83_009021 [Entophlyctis luteolus]|nr:hypothetical protein HDU83_009021 [Entophlyctis luteolus]KAJ3387943.1 hypothetical protein HDU84_000406 [Entophlyctis sp. JEL0112]
MVSIRSSKKKHFRAIRREKASASEIFKPVEDARLAAVARLLHAKEPAADSASTEDSRNGEGTADVTLDGSEKPKDVKKPETATETISLESVKSLSKIEREKIMLSRNQFKKKQKARAASKVGGKGALHQTKPRKRSRFTPI